MRSSRPKPQRNPLLLSQPPQSVSEKRWDVPILFIREWERAPGPLTYFLIKTVAPNSDAPTEQNKKSTGSRVLFVSKPFTRSFWMMPVSSSMVILNLIANLPFLYHKPEKPAVLALTDPDHLRSAGRVPGC
jgi:hypothetical protein